MAATLMNWLLNLKTDTLKAVLQPILTLLALHGRLQQVDAVISQYWKMLAYDASTQDGTCL
jgi:hypothetical protein